jgi:hypothetical protein
MDEQDFTAVDDAFDILLEEIDNVIVEMNQSGSRAFSENKLEVAEQVLSRAKALTNFRSEVASLRERWADLCNPQYKKGKAIGSRRNLGRLKKGLRTKKACYYVPILQALSEMGGHGQTRDVLDRVYDIMKNSLKPVDEKPLPSDPNTPRWRNTACWAREHMVREGLLKSDSPRGIWEISEAGRKWLESENKWGDTDYGPALFTT